MISEEDSSFFEFEAANEVDYATVPAYDINDQLKAYLKDEGETKDEIRTVENEVAGTQTLVKPNPMDLKTSRMPPSNPTEPKSELLRFIAQKEGQIFKLREELLAQEDELQLLKGRLDELVVEERGPAAIGDHARRRAFSLPPITTSRGVANSSSSLPQSARSGSLLSGITGDRPLSPTILEGEEAFVNAGKAVYENLNRGIFTLFQSTQRFLESDSFQQTKNMAFQMGHEAIRNTREITTEVTTAIAESETFQTGRQITREVIDNVVHVTQEVLAGDFGGVPENDIVLPPPRTLGRDANERDYVGHAENGEEGDEVEERQG